MRSNDRWISCLAWVLFSFITISSQAFIFWPWLFGAQSGPAASALDLLDPSSSHEAVNNENGSAVVDNETGSYFGYISILWSNLNVRALLYLIPFNFSLAMLCWNYVLTMMTDPGTAPHDWNPPIDGSSVEYKQTTHTPRYCRTCDAYKPPRTHHCRACKKCVLKMDHHCPWVGNCIGFFNYGHFVRFIIWTNISTFICAALLILRCMEAYENEQLGINLSSAPSPEEIILIVVDLCLDGSVLFGISILTIYHIWCISSNTTTIESWEKDRVLTILRRGKISDIKCPYNQGVLANFQEVLGHNPLLWLWPQPMLGDGLRFKVRRGKEEMFNEMPSNNEPSSLSSSRTPMSTPWFRPFDSAQHQRDDLLEMV